MSGTVDSIHSTISLKIKHIYKILSILSNVDVYEIAQFTQKLQIINQRYTAIILQHNFVNKSYLEFIKEININGIILDMNRLVYLINLFANKCNINIKKYIDDYEDCYIDINLDDVFINLCTSCSEELVIDETNSEYICKKCGITKKAIIEVDEQKYIDPGNRSVKPHYNPLQQFRIWIDRIQSTVAVDIDKEVIHKIVQYIQRDKIKNLDNLTCESIRSYLKEMNRADLNNIIPAIHAKITDNEPPKLTEEEIIKITGIFNRVIESYKNLKTIEKSNTKYYPYFIYKIIEITLDANKRRSDILSYIHLQSSGTVAENDAIWFEICDILGYKKKPTIRL